jgi:hypothetical protein
MEPSQMMRSVACPYGKELLSSSTGDGVTALRGTFNFFATCNKSSARQVILSK